MKISATGGAGDLDGVDHFLYGGEVGVFEYLSCEYGHEYVVADVEEDHEL
jgi:hypothetical protein